MKKYKTLLVLTITTLVVLLACKKEQPDFNKAPQDPCACASEVSADFVIEERATHIPEEIWVETDTTLHNKRVRFRALEEDAEYTWYIGLDVETDQAPWKFFSDQWKGHDIPITLVVKKEPNNTCFPDDDGYDSITKYFHVSQYPIMPDPNDADRTIHHAGLTGTYRMIGEGMSDSIDIEVHMELFGLSSRIVHIKNLDGEGTYCDFESLDGQAWRRVVHWAYREVKFGDPLGHVTFCKTLYGTIRNRIDGVAEMDFEIKISDPPNPQVTTYIHYLGRKIN
jgi:hypothetical protein